MFVTTNPDLSKMADYMGIEFKVQKLLEHLKLLYNLRIHLKYVITVRKKYNYEAQWGGKLCILCTLFYNLYRSFFFSP